MYWGTLLEPIVAAHYTRRTGNKVRRVNAVLQHPIDPGCWPTWTERSSGARPTCRFWNARPPASTVPGSGEDGVPEYVQLQVMHQLAVTGKRAADVAVLMGGQDLQVFRIERDED
jgi:predicted phage-related endonuclease